MVELIRVVWQAFLAEFRAWCESCLRQTGMSHRADDDAPERTVYSGTIQADSP